jgi:hypothetical protein
MAWSADVAAWENFPEFQSLAEIEQEQGFEGPGRLNPEYFSDAQAYSVPPEWEYQWLSRPKALQLDFGSLDTTRFLMENRLKIHQPVSERFELRFTYFEEANRERQSSHAIIEVIFSPWKWLGLVFYGEPSFRKPNDDTGLALLLRPSERHEIRLFNTYVDVTRLKYPDTGDTFVEPDLPYARGIVGRAWGEAHPDTGLGDFVEYAARYETPTRWKFVDDNYLYSYWKGLAWLYGRKQFSGAVAGAARAQWDRKHEAREATGATSAKLGDWMTDRLTVMTEATFYRLGPLPGWEWTAGLEYAHRGWATDEGDGNYRDLLPYARVRIPAFGGAPYRGSLILGYSASWHQEGGSEAIGIRPWQSGEIEQRFNLIYEFALGAMGSLKILASADLDEIGSRRSWGGGSGQLLLYF